jgi:hypothetical protein
MVRASNGDFFSYRYAVPGDPAREPAEFEYTNHTQGGTFCLQSLTWHAFFHSRSRGRGEPDALVLTGYGGWSRDAAAGLHVVTFHVSTAPDFPYVSVQIDGGLVSNVNSKPADEATTLP